MPILGAFIVPHPPLIIPAVGKGEERKIQKTIDSYQNVADRIAALRPDTIIVTTPHSILYADYLHISPGSSAQGSFKDFGALQVQMKVEYDTLLAESIEQKAGEQGIRAGFLGERNKSLDHGTMVPLHFILPKCPNVKVVRISLSGFSLLTHYRFGSCIAKAVEESDKRVVFVASGDLSHKLKEDGPYGFAKEGPVFDQTVTEAMAKGDFLSFLEFEEDFCDAASECGLRSFVIMAGALDGRNVSSELLSYEGPFGVGYGVAAYEPLGENDERRFGEIYQKKLNIHLETIKAHEDSFVKLARSTIENYVRFKKKIPRPDDLPKTLTDGRAGVFVSLKKDGRLRGCIGTIFPTTASIADEIIQNAISSATADNRFDPVEEYELPDLVYSVDVLGVPEPIGSREELDPKRYGVIVRMKNRCGLLLPNLEGIDSAEQQVGIALKKGNIGEKEPFSMERFEVIRHH